MRLKDKEEATQMSLKPPIIDSLTGIRALGALWIVLFHMRAELMPLIGNSIILQNFVSAGHIGVTLFFILSGFVLSYNYCQTFSSLNASAYFNFLGQRLARIYPIHLATLLFFLTLVIAANLAGHTFESPERYTTLKFFKHIFLINGWSIPIETSWNGVAWTLSLEWLCYLLFPFLALLVSKIKNSFLPLLLITFILVTTISLKAPGGVYEVIMFLEGILLGKLYTSRFGENFSWQPITFISLLIIIGLGSSLATLNLRTSNIAVFVVVFIYGLAWGGSLSNKVFGSKWMIYLGYTSYSLYMTHPIALKILRMFFSEQSVQAMGKPQVFVLVLSYICIILLVARLTYSLVEEPARKWMKLGLKSASLKFKKV